MRLSLTLSILTLAVTATTAAAQTWLDYDQALARFTWLRTANAAALTTYQPADSTQRLLADASISGVTQHGHFAPNGTAPHQWQAGADARSICRIGNRVVLRGSMSYAHRWATDAAGSIWIAPENMPFDITEVTDTTLGNTRLEQFGFNGEAAVAVGSNISLGARFAYGTASYAKQKDPRHTNSLMRLTATAGATWHAAGVTLGANYVINRSTEAVTLRTYGRTDRVYHYLIDFGAAYGRLEQADGKGYTGNDYERPLLDMQHGLALQGGYENRAWSAVAQWQWLHRHGHYGLESPSHIDFNRHNGDMWNATAWLQHARGNDLYRLTFDWRHENLRDYERTYRIITDGGITDVTYYDDRLMGRRQVIDYTLTADAGWNINRHLAQWELSITLNHHRNSTDAVLFPFYRRQHTHLTTVRAIVTRNWLTTRDHVWTLSAALDWGDGGGTPTTDSTLGTASDEAQQPAQHNELLMREFEWHTAGRMGATIAARWAMPVANARARIYVDASANLCHASSISHLTDAHRHSMALAVGCLF